MSNIYSGYSKFLKDYFKYISYDKVDGAHITPDKIQSIF